MGMPSGESPEHAQQYYQYLQGHKETMQHAPTHGTSNGSSWRGSGAS